MRVGAIAAACAFAFGPLAAQDSTRTVQDFAVRVFLDCPDTFCDFDYYRTEITFVNWVRDRQFAQVHVLVTTQRTGGGQEFTLAFIGLERFAGTVDTLRRLSHTTDTEDDVRRGVAQTMRLGLVRFAAKTPVAPNLAISYSAPVSTAAQVQDPWNYWVFSASLSGNFNGEKSIKFQYWSGRLSAERLTDTWKITFSANQSYNQGDYSTPVFDSSGTQIGEEKVRNISRGKNANALIVRSLGAHWSFGVRGLASSSTFLNQKLAARIAPAIEYDVIPYSQSTRRLLTFRSLSIKQPWGSAGVSIEGSNYLYDFRKNRLTFFGNGDFRVYKGLSVRLFGSVGLIHDQLSIPKVGASEQDVLLQRRQLATSYQYFGFFMLSYTFGSKFANIVNPRFGDGGGGGFFFSN